MAKADGYIRINTKVDTSGAKAGLGSLMGTLSKFAIAAGLAFGVKAVIDFGKQCIDLASDLAEVQNVVDVTFGGSAEKINAFATSAATSFGLSQLAAKQYTGTMGAMFKSMGFGASEAADMSIAMAGLAGDMASFYNLDTDEAFAKIRSGISGETEPLKQLGINLSAANLEAFALTQGITGGYAALSEQNKALMRYNYLLETTADAQGDFQRTSGGWANQVRILGLQFDTLKSTLGGAFIAVLAPVLKWINLLLGSLNSVAVVFANFITALTGKQQTATTATAGTTAAMDDLTASTEESGNAAAAAGKKAAKGAEGFDELNIQAADTSAGGAAASGGAVASTTTAAAATVTPDLGTDAMVEKLKEFFGKYQEEIDLITGSWEELKTTVVGIFEDLSAQVQGTDILGAGFEAALSWVYAMEEEINLLLSVLGKLVIAFNIPATIESGLNLAAAAYKAVGDAIDAITPGIEAFVDIALVPIVEWLGGKVRDALDFFAEQFKKIGDWFQSNKDTFTEVFTNLGDAVAAVWDYVSPILDAIWEVLKTIFSQVVDGALSIADSLAPVINKASEFVTAFMGWLQTSGIMDQVIAGVQFVGQIIGDVIDVVIGVIQGLLEILGGVLDFLTGVFTGDWDKAWQGIQEIFSGIISILTTVIQGWKDILSDIWNSISKTVTDVWNGIAKFFTDLWTSITDAYTTNWNAMIEFFTGLWASITKGYTDSWNAMAKFFTDLWNSITKGVTDCWNAISKFFTDLWGSITKGVTDAWNAIGKFFTDLWDDISSVATEAWNGISDFFTDIWKGITDMASDAVATLQEVWGSICDWFTKNVIDPLSDAFTAMQTVLADIWDGIWDGAKGAINNIIGGIEGLVNGIASGINTIINGVNKVVTTAGSLLGLSVSIPTLGTVTLPRLAEGAVIPPNRAFAAILGDQKHGTNIETPLDTMLQAFRAAFKEAGNTGATQVQIVFKGELAALAGILAPEITIAQNDNNRAAGKTLQVV